MGTDFITQHVLTLIPMQDTDQYVPAVCLATEAIQISWLSQLSPKLLQAW